MFEEREKIKLQACSYALLFDSKRFNFILGGISFWEEFHFGRRSVLGGIPFWEEFHFGRNPDSGGNPFLGGILFREEPHFGRNPGL